ncbi:MAG: hypothetical protein QM490_01740 [Candidatus Gracilibacteria bacterium]
MGLEDYTPEIESSEGGGNSAEAAKDASEKYKESTKKAGAKVAKTQKDEKKAKKYDFLLAGFLVKIIINKKYDSILESLFAPMHAGFSSSFILGILSLIYIEVSNKIREVSEKEQIKFLYNSKDEIEEFDDNHINPQIKNRINYWVEDIVDSVTLEYSDIQTIKLKSLLKTDKDLLLTYTSQVFSFFLKEINISISETKSLNISEFIISEIKKSVDKLEVKNIL